MIELSGFNETKKRNVIVNKTFGATGNNIILPNETSAKQIITASGENENYTLKELKSDSILINLIEYAVYDENGKHIMDLSFSLYDKKCTISGVAGSGIERKVIDFK